MAERLVYILYIFCIIYASVYFGIFVARKYILHDEKLKGVSFFKFFCNTSNYSNKLKGDK